VVIQRGQVGVGFLKAPATLDIPATRQGGCGFSHRGRRVHPAGLDSVVKVHTQGAGDDLDPVRFNLLRRGERFHAVPVLGGCRIGAGVPRPTFPT